MGEEPSFSEVARKSVVRTLEISSILAREEVILAKSTGFSFFTNRISISSSFLYWFYIFVIAKRINKKYFYSKKGRYFMKPPREDSLIY
jgi:hypothetical protein